MNLEFSSRPLNEDTLSGLLGSFPGRLKPPVVLCIGTDRLIGDSLGPLVGTLLERSGRCGLPVYGTLSAPVHALNIDEIQLEIKKKHPDSLVIAVDASLGDPCRVGCVSLHSGSLHPGSGVNKQLTAAGDISITGITGAETSHPYLALQTARLSTVMGMAENICGCILNLDRMCHAPVTGQYQPC